MYEIKVDVIGLKTRKLVIKHLFIVFAGVYVKFGGNVECVAVVFAHAFAYAALRISVVVYVSGIKVIDAVFVCVIYNFKRIFVDNALTFGIARVKAHVSQTQHGKFNVFKRFLYHEIPPLSKENSYPHKQFNIHTTQEIE
jgi:hypothetical protein